MKLKFRKLANLNMDCFVNSKMALTALYVELLSRKRFGK